MVSYRYSKGDKVKTKLYGEVIISELTISSLGEPAYYVQSINTHDKRHYFTEKDLLDLYAEALKENKLNVDMVNSPAHYTAGKVECIDALEAATTGLQGIEAVCVANAIKYLWRHKHKNGIEDCKKARWYIDRLIKHYEGAQ